MSAIFNSVGAFSGVAESIKNKGNIFDGRLSQYSGSKYKGARKGEASVLDGDQSQQRHKNDQIRLGAGSYKVKYMSTTNEPLANTIIEQDGHAFETDADGVINYVDEHYLNEKYKEIMQVESYIRKIMKVAKTDDMLQKLLGISADDMRAMCAADGTIDGITLPEELKINCLPSIINLYPAGSMQEAAAYSKLKLIVSTFLPCIKSAKETRPKKHLAETPSGEAVAQEEDEEE